MHEGAVAAREGGRRRRFARPARRSSGFSHRSRRRPATRTTRRHASSSTDAPSSCRTKLARAGAEAARAQGGRIGRWSRRRSTKTTSPTWSADGPASRSAGCWRARRRSCSRWRSGCTSGVVGQDEAVDGRLGRHPPGSRRPEGSQPAHRLIHLPGPDRRGKDGAGPGAGRVPVRRRAGDGAHRHERVHGEAHRVAPDRRAAGLRRLRGGRPAHRGGAPPPVPGRAVRRDREGAPRRLQRAAAGAGRRPPDRLARGARSTSRTRSSS